MKRVDWDHVASSCFAICACALMITLTFAACRWLVTR